MRHLARGLEEALTPGVRLSDCHLNKHRLINSLWTKVSERSEGVCPERCHSALLNPQNFANTIGKPTGAIVNLSTMVAAYGAPGMSLYGSSKAALNLLTKTWAAEYGPSGVRINAMSPGPTRTEGTDAMGRGWSSSPPRRQRVVRRPRTRLR